MHTYKLTDKSTSEYIIESSSTYPPEKPGRYNSIVEDFFNRPDIEFEDLGEVDKPFISNWHKYVKAIEQVNLDSGFNLKNGRFRVDDILKTKDLNYVYIVHCIPTDTYLVDCTRNVLDKLYRMFVGDRARETLKEDISKYGCKSFKVTILDPVSSDDTSITWLEAFESVMNNDGTNLYNKSKYDKLTNCVK